MAKAAGKKKSPADNSKPFLAALRAWKRATKKNGGLVSTVDAQPALRMLVEAWPALDHRLKYRLLPKTGDLCVRVWRVHELDILTAADACGIDAHVLLRVFDRARKFGVVYPDGTLHPDVREYVKRRSENAGSRGGNVSVTVIPPTSEPIGFGS